MIRKAFLSACVLALVCIAAFLASVGYGLVVYPTQPPWAPAWYDDWVWGSAVGVFVSVMAIVCFLPWDRR